MASGNNSGGQGWDLGRGNAFGRLAAKQAQRPNAIAQAKSLAGRFNPGQQSKALNAITQAKALAELRADRSKAAPAPKAPVPKPFPRSENLERLVRQLAGRQRPNTRAMANSNSVRRAKQLANTRLFTEPERPNAIAQAKQIANTRLFAEPERPNSVRRAKQIANRTV